MPTRAPRWTRHTLAEGQGGVGIAGAGLPSRDRLALDTGMPASKGRPIAPPSRARPCPPERRGGHGTHSPRVRVGSGSRGLGCRHGIGWPWIPECRLPRGGRYRDSDLGTDAVLLLRRARLGRPIPPARPDLARKQHRSGGAVFGGGAVWWCGFKPSLPLASRLNHTTTPPLMYRYIYDDLFFLGWCGPEIRATDRGSCSGSPTSIPVAPFLLVGGLVTPVRLAKGLSDGLTIPHTPREEQTNGKPSTGPSREPRQSAGASRGFHRGERERENDSRTREGQGRSCLVS